MDKWQKIVVDEVKNGCKTSDELERILKERGASKEDIRRVLFSELTSEKIPNSNLIIIRLAYEPKIIVDLAAHSSGDREKNIPPKTLLAYYMEK